MIAIASTGSAANFTFPGFNHGILPDGNYRATLTADAIKDLAGNHPATNPTLDFFVFAGDANRDRSVGFANLVAVAQTRQSRRRHLVAQ